MESRADMFSIKVPFILQVQHGLWKGGREGQRMFLIVFKKGLENTLIHNTQSLENLITLMKMIFCLSVVF